MSSGPVGVAWASVAVLMSSATVAAQPAHAQDCSLSNRRELSVLQGDSMAVNWLLTHGTDPNEADGYGWTPLHFAVPFAGLEAVSGLLAAGADVDARTASGPTALHLAAIDVMDGPAAGAGRDAVVYVRSMIDNELTAAAAWQPGDRVRLALEPWAGVAPDLDGINRGELSDPALLLVEPWWGEP